MDAITNFHIDRGFPANTNMANLPGIVIWSRRAIGSFITMEDGCEGRRITCWSSGVVFAEFKLHPHADGGLVEILSELVTSNMVEILESMVVDRVSAGVAAINDRIRKAQ